MKRTFLALIAATFVSLTVAPVFADETDLKSQKGIEKFWEQNKVETSGG